MKTWIDINTALSFVFQDNDWVKKILVGGLLSLTLIGLIPVAGWALEIQRRVIAGEEDDLLPDWSGLGRYTLDGLKMFAVSLVWYLPVTLAWVLFAGCYVSVLVFTSELGSDILTVFSALGFMLIIPVVTLVSYGMYALFPIPTGLLAETNSIKAALNIRQGLQLLRANIFECIAVALLAYIISYVVSMVGFFLCGIGLFFLNPIMMAIMFHFFGQAYANAKIKLAAQVEG